MFISNVIFSNTMETAITLPHAILPYKGIIHYHRSKYLHENVMTWICFPHYWLFRRGVSSNVTVMNISSLHLECIQSDDKWVS